MSYWQNKRSVAPSARGSKPSSDPTGPHPPYGRARGLFLKRNTSVSAQHGIPNLWRPSDQVPVGLEKKGSNPTATACSAMRYAAAFQD